MIDAILAKEDELPRAERELLDDSFRVVTLACSYLDGAETLAQHMESRGRPHWQYLGYKRLADDYVAKGTLLRQCYHLADVHRTQPARRARTGRAPRHDRHADRRGLPHGSDSHEAVFRRTRYGVHSDFWDVHDATVKQGYAKTLKTYLNELAALDHAKAQSKKGKRADYLAAARWYEELVLTFPADAATANNLFLLGEVYTEAKEVERAVAAYQRVVREHPEFKDAPEAGYAAVLGLGVLAENARNAKPSAWTEKLIEAQIEFAMTFTGDARAVSRADGRCGQPLPHGSASVRRWTSRRTS